MSCQFLWVRLFLYYLELVSNCYYEGDVTEDIAKLLSLKVEQCHSHLQCVQKCTWNHIGINYSDGLKGSEGTCQPGQHVSVAH